MAPDPILITRAGGPTPYSYGLGATERFVLESISARWDGSAAAAAFWPAVSVYAPDGSLIGRYIPPASIAAGDSGEVTYGPF